jgi:hypothetical protein
VNVAVVQMGSIDTFTDTASSEASTVAAAAAIVDEPNNKEDLGDSPDEGPPFPLYAGCFLVMLD